MPQRVKDENSLTPQQIADAKRLKALWDSKHGDVSQAEFGERYNLGTQGMVSQYLLARRPLNLKAARAFATFLSIKVEDFSKSLAEEMKGYYVADDSGRYEVGRAFLGVPVVGTAQLGPKGHWLELEHPVGHGDGRINFASRDKNAYAVRVVGDSMFPRIKSGEFVVCEPGASYGPDDDVLVVTTDGRSMVKRFVVERDGMITLESYNHEHGRMTLKRTEIAKIHRVAAIANGAAFLPE